MSTNRSASTSRSGASSFSIPARSACGSWLAFHLTAEAPAQITSPKRLPRIESMLRDAYSSSNGCCALRTPPTNPVCPISAVGISGIAPPQHRREERLEHHGAALERADLRGHRPRGGIRARHRQLAQVGTEAGGG